MAVYNIHGGHSLYCRGASKHLDEVNEDRKVKDKVIALLRAEGHTVYDCTDDDGRTQQQNLSNIVKKCNEHSVALDVSIHLNAGGGTGVEVENYDNRTKVISDRICANISSALGIKNRGTKYMPNLYVLSNTKSLAILIECCFVDNMTDYYAWNVDKCAKAIVEGILGRTIKVGTESKTEEQIKPAPSINATKKKIDVVHQVNARGKGWLAEVTNHNNYGSNGYSGWFGLPMVAFRAKTKGNAKEVGYLEYRAHALGGKWFDWRRDYNKDNTGDTFAGDGKTVIDGLQFRIVGVPGRHTRYRVHVIGKGWLDWVTDYGSSNDGYAGWYGHAIDAVQVEVI